MTIHWKAAEQCFTVVQFWKIYILGTLRSETVKSETALIGSLGSLPHLFFFYCGIIISLFNDFFIDNACRCFAHIMLSKDFATCKMCVHVVCKPELLAC